VHADARCRRLRARDGGQRDIEFPLVGAFVFACVADVALCDESRAVAEADRITGDETLDAYGMMSFVAADGDGDRRREISDVTGLGGLITRLSVEIRMEDEM